MKLKINDNMIIVGTPEEMSQFIRLTQMPEDGGPFEPPEQKVITPETPEKPKAKRKLVDWPKAEALRAAGWSQRKIADELGIHETTVSNHFRKAKGAEHEGTDEPV